MDLLEVWKLLLLRMVLVIIIKVLTNSTMNLDRSHLLVDFMEAFTMDVCVPLEFMSTLSSRLMNSPFNFNIIGVVGLILLKLRSWYV